MNMDVGKYAVLFKVGRYEFDNRLHICYKDESGNKFSLAYFEKTKEGYDLRFVGGRPFKYCYCDETSFMGFANACFKYTEVLDAFGEMGNE